MFKGSKVSLGCPLGRGTILALVSLTVYLLIVVATTPTLPALDALIVAFKVNWWIIGGISLGVGTQSFLVAYAKQRACKLTTGRRATSSCGLLSAFSSFLSYVALIPLGCCGTWLYIISFLPAILGVGASSFIVADSRSLAVVSLLVMTAPIAYTGLSIRRRLKFHPRTERHVE